MPQTGDTIKLSFEFIDYDRVTRFDPSNIVLSIFDAGTRTKIGQSISYSADTWSHDSLGNYSYEYTIPDNIRKNIILEVVGTRGSKPVVKRIDIPIAWK